MSWETETGSCWHFQLVNYSHWSILMFNLTLNKLDQESHIVSMKLYFKIIWAEMTTRGGQNLDNFKKKFYYIFPIWKIEKYLVIFITLFLVCTQLYISIRFFSLFVKVKNKLTKTKLTELSLTKPNQLTQRKPSLTKPSQTRYGLLYGPVLVQYSS